MTFSKMITLLGVLVLVCTSVVQCKDCVILQQDDKDETMTLNCSISDLIAFNDDNFFISTKLHVYFGDMLADVGEDPDFIYRLLLISLRSW
jgi:hypothetical protein